MIRLTQTVQKGGCAAKVAASELRKILNQVRFPPLDKNVLVDGAGFDDASIYKINEDLALVQTLDFFTPIVDTPELFGKIAAANAISDIYAMGGDPKTAMAILAFPMATMDTSIAVEVLQGASDIMKEAGVSFVGGHSIDDDTLKFGLSVTGFVNPKKVWSNAQAQPGDVLILTKPLGTGTLTAGLKRQVFSENEIVQATASMSQLNRIIDLIPESMAEAIHSATDITGFGLLGHGLQMAKASGVSLQFSHSSLPVFTHVWKSLQDGLLTKAHRTNANYVENVSMISDRLDWQKQILFDPQTSGGLLLSVSPKNADELLERLQPRFSFSRIIGKVKTETNFLLEVTE